MTLTVDELMDMHVRCNLGVYFSAVSDLGSDLRYATSEHIADFYWNYGYRTGGSSIAGDQLERIVTFARNANRSPALWQLANEPVLASCSVASEEAWMTLDLAGLGPMQRPGLDDLKVETSTVPTAEMRKVFDNAYSSGGSPGDVGYFDLPHEYGDAYESGATRPPGRSVQVAAYVGGTCAVVASLQFVDDCVGMYSVATHHDWRRRGLAKFLSSEALLMAQRSGARLAFLQTESQSSVEDLYESLGFKTLFRGALLSVIDE